MGLRIRRAGAGPALGLAMLLCGCGAYTSHPDRAAAGPVAASAGATYQAPAGRWCAASDLTYEVNGNGIWHGQLTDDATISNASSSVCSMPAAPRVDITQGGAGPTLVDPGGETSDRFDLSPRQVVELVIACDSGPAVVRTTAEVGLAGGASLSVEGLHLTAPCKDADMIAFQQGPGPSPTGMGALAPSVVLPAVARAGMEFQYTVTLTNNGAASVPLAPCPSYTERLLEPTAAEMPREDLTHPLDCRAGVIAPGRSVTFELAMPVPAAWGPGTAKFGWSLEVDGQPAAGGTITIE